jgi:ABC-2 type transport system ATP-binding protein
MNYSAAVVVSDLVVRRGRSEILRGVDARIPEGQVVGLLGPSGSGKTTLMRAVVGLQRIAGGSVTVLGLPAGSPRLRDQVGYAPQETSVYTDLTVVENMRYFAACLHADSSEVDRVMEEVELTPYARRLAGRLSGGQLSRVSLAVALIGSPRLLVLDEPTVGLDPVLRDQLWRMFGRLADRGTSLLVSSHVMDEAERCQDLVLLRDGAVLASASPAELKRRTATESRDAAFLRLITGGEDAA